MTVPTQCFRNEHTELSGMLQILEGICQAMESEALVAAEDIADMARFLENFSEIDHHGKEEDYLLPELSKIGMGADHGAVHKMLLEHQQALTLIERIQEAIAGMREGRNRMAEFCDASQEYISMSRRHLQLENEKLFDPLDQKLDPVSAESLSATLSSLQAEDQATGRYQSMHEALDRLRSRYLA
ncbi:MAG: hemerythrin domain-containing protein [Gammaproteobacteria bacterium]|nr:hemerythrin domain-containing protein [Gammaproteobacteria bacterium]